MTEQLDLNSTLTTRKKRLTSGMSFNNSFLNYLWKVVLFLSLILAANGSLKFALRLRDFITFVFNQK